MLTRVVFPAVSMFALSFGAAPATAQDALSYETRNFYAASGNTPQIGYQLDGLLFDRVPDHIALAYRLEGLTGYVPQYRDGRDVSPLQYEFRGLLFNNYAGVIGEGPPSLISAD